MLTSPTCLLFIVFFLLLLFIFVSFFLTPSGALNMARTSVLETSAYVMFPSVVKIMGSGFRPSAYEPLDKPFNLSQFPHV